MNLIEAFFEELHIPVPYDLPDISYDEDKSDFNYVDGEEGDNGVIKYYDKSTNELLCTYYIFGGDEYNIIFTDFFKIKYKYIVNDFIENLIKNL